MSVETDDVMSYTLAQGLEVSPPPPVSSFGLGLSPRFLSSDAGLLAYMRTKVEWLRRKDCMNPKVVDGAFAAADVGATEGGEAKLQTVLFSKAASNDKNSVRTFVAASK